MNRPLGFLPLAVVLACAPARAPLVTEASPGVVFPVHVAEGKGGGAPVRSAAPPSSAPPSASAAPGTTAPGAASATPVAPRPSPPDPTPLRMADQYELGVVWENGTVRLESVKAKKFKQPVVTARKMGRFAVELWIGHELVERVRFDFPLLADEEPKKGGRHSLNEPVSFAGGTLRATVLVPASPRARRALILDRATNKETPVDWPPVVASPSAAPSVAPGSAPPSPKPSAAPPPSPKPSSAAPAAAPHG